jgi:hypothetical protein
MGNPATAIRDFYDYTQYNHSTFGHLNTDRLASVSGYRRRGLSAGRCSSGSGR